MIERIEPVVFVAVIVVAALLAISGLVVVRWQRLARATEYLTGYASGFDDARTGRVPAFLTKDGGR